MTAPARRRLSALLTAASVAFLYLAAAEAVLRFLPVATGLASVAVSTQQPIFHFAPDRQFVYSEGWRLLHVNRGRVNNDGWVNDQDYRRDDKLPLIAVIGDSYIEAQPVPYAETMQGRLAAALKGRFRVYSVAASGAPLSEFAVYAGYAAHTLGASAVVLNVANYDFADSDAAFAAPLGMWVYAGAAGDRHLELVPYRLGWLRRLVRQSALLRYLALNLRLDRLAGSVNPVGTANAATRTARFAASEAVIGDFFRDLPLLAGLPPGRVLFIMDGFRYPAAAAAAAGSAEDRLRREFRHVAASHGYETVDLDPLFFARTRQDGAHFELPGDRHWNAAGHAVAASGVLSSRLLAGLGAGAGDANRRQSDPPTRP